MVDKQKGLAPPAEALLRPLRHLLRPLVRLAITSGVTFPLFAELLRGLYVEVAEQDLLPDMAARTDSRISLLTGVHRKEIRRLRLDPTTDAGIPEVVTVSSQVIGYWLGQASYTDRAGRPLALPRLRAAAGGPSFEALVESVTTDIRSRAVLDDFVAQGLVTLEPGDIVRLNQAAFIPRQGRPEQLFFFARNLHDHIAAASANVALRDGPHFLDSSVHYDRLDPEMAASLTVLAQQAAQDALLSVNRAALEFVRHAPSGPARPAAPMQRVNFGVYLYVAVDEPDKTEES